MAAAFAVDEILGGPSRRNEHPQRRVEKASFEVGERVEELARDISERDPVGTRLLTTSRAVPIRQFGCAVLAAIHMSGVLSGGGAARSKYRAWQRGVALSDIRLNRAESDIMLIIRKLMVGLAAGLTAR